MDSGPRDFADSLWLGAAALAAPLLVWWLWGDHLVAWIFHFKLVQLRLLHTLGLGDAGSAELAAALRGALLAPDRVSFETFVFGLGAVGGYWRGPAAAALAVLAAWLLVLHPAGRFRRRLDLKGLAETQKAVWPYALHALRRGNQHLPADDPVWGLSLSPRAWLRRHALLEPTGGGWSLRERRAEAALVAQLGVPWRDAPAHARALAGIFAMRVASRSADRRESERLDARALDLLRRLALAAAEHKAGGYLPPARAFARAIAAGAPHLTAGTLQPLLARHAYTPTVLLALLAEARGGGVLPAALFSWLKGVDRPLWYALDSLGRRMPYAEGLAALGHFEAERQAGAALVVPALEAALESLRAEIARLPPPPPGAAGVSG